MPVFVLTYQIINHKSPLPNPASLPSLQPRPNEVLVKKRKGINNKGNSARHVDAQVSGISHLGFPDSGLAVSGPTWS